MANTLSASITDGDAYTWTAPTADIDAGDTLLLVKNTSNRNLRIDSADITGGNVASLYTITKHFAVDAQTPAGTAVSGVSLSGRKDNNLASTGAISKSDETGYSAAGTAIKQLAAGVTTSVSVNLHGLVLAPNEAIGAV
ncbi:MAG: hypothetical protein ACYS26_22590 [Planctomycetota bacterium]|jgi:hypothetical protein